MQISGPSAARLPSCSRAGALQRPAASPAPWRNGAVRGSPTHGRWTAPSVQRSLRPRSQPPVRASGPSNGKEPESQLEQFRRLFEQVAAWRQREAERQQLMDDALLGANSSGGSSGDGAQPAAAGDSIASGESAALNDSTSTKNMAPAEAGISGKEAEEVGQVEPLAAQGAAAADEVLFSAEQLAAGAAGAAEDASDAMTAAQRAAQRAVGDVASDAADAAAAAQRAAQRAAADVASDATDAVTATQRAAERMLSDVQQQATQAAASAVQGAAEAAAAAAAEAAGAASAVASAAGSAAAPARSPQGQLSAPAGPAASLQAPEPPAGSLSAPKPPAGALEAPQAPAGSLAAPEQPVASLPPPAEPASQASSSSSGASTSGGPGPNGEGSSAGRVGRGSGAADRAEEIAAVKQQLVSMLASLDRGAAATEDQAQRVDNLARRLELLGGAVSLGSDKPAGGGKPGMALLDGRWRLLYSSGFTSGSLGGRRPGPSFGSLPLTLGPVYQDVYTDKSELDNVVELFLRFSLASLPGVSAGVPSATARLRHSYQIIGANTIEITFEDTEVKLAGGLQGWLDNLPTFAVPKLPEFLQTPKGVRSARFDVVFLDESMRITRGDRDELRVFLKGAV